MHIPFLRAVGSLSVLGSIGCDAALSPTDAGLTAPPLLR